MKKIMKHVIPGILASLLILGVCGCGDELSGNSLTGTVADTASSYILLQVFDTDTLAGIVTDDSISEKQATKYIYSDSCTEYCEDGITVIYSCTDGYYEGFEYWSGNGAAEEGWDGIGFPSSYLSGYADTASEGNLYYMVPAGTDGIVVSMKNSGGNIITSEHLGEAVPFTIESKEYYAYNHFVDYTSGSNWQDAMNYVDLLNKASYQGHTDWQLLDSRKMAGYWYVTEFINSYIKNVTVVWSSDPDVAGSNSRYPKTVTDGKWVGQYKDHDESEYGFVVVRPAD